MKALSDQPRTHYKRPEKACVLIPICPPRRNEDRAGYLRLDAATRAEQRKLARGSMAGELSADVS